MEARENYEDLYQFLRYVFNKNYCSIGYCLLIDWSASGGQYCHPQNSAGQVVKAELEMGNMHFAGSAHRTACRGRMRDRMGRAWWIRNAFSFICITSLLDYFIHSSRSGVSSVYLVHWIHLVYDSGEIVGALLGFGWYLPNRFPHYYSLMEIREGSHYLHTSSLRCFLSLAILPHTFQDCPVRL